MLIDKKELKWKEKFIYGREIIIGVIVPLLSGIIGGFFGGYITIKKYINKQNQNNDNQSVGIQIGVINKRRKRWNKLIKKDL